MQANQKSATADGVVWVRIASSALGKQGHVTAADANKIATEQGVGATATILDESGAIGRLYDAKTTPHMYVINPEGVLVYAGAIDDNDSSKTKDVAGAKNYVMAALGSLKNGTAIEPAATKAYGCSIKYAD
jgi:hypothetical protein